MVVINGDNVDDKWWWWLMDDINNVDRCWCWLMLLLMILIILMDDSVVDYVVVNDTNG